MEVGSENVLVALQCSTPSCIVAFHVTCAFDHGLEMKTILAENDEVRFKSFCRDHSSAANNANGNHAVSSAANGVNGAARSEQRHEPDGSGDPEQSRASHPVSASERAERDQLEREKVSQRKQKLQELEDEFYRLVEPSEVAEHLGLPLLQVRLAAHPTLQKTNKQGHF